MGNVKKLLNRPFRAFTTYSLIILLISIPAYYFVVSWIWANELDEHNYQILGHIKSAAAAKKLSESDLQQMNQVWAKFIPGISIVENKGIPIAKDKTYSIERHLNEKGAPVEDSYRVLQSNLRLENKNYLITIETNVEEADETLLAIAIVTAIFFVMLISGFIFLNKRIAAKSWQAFYKTLDKLKEFELSDEKILQTPETDIEEFQELNTALQKLVDKNIQTYQLQKRFTENAAHELQTPIAILKSKLDLLFQEKNLSPEVSEIVNSIEVPLARLSRVNKNLLLLAKIEHLNNADVERINISENILASLSYLQDYITDKQLNVSADLDEQSVINANLFLFETMINNFLTNAIRYTPTKGAIKIALKDKNLVFANSGTKALSSLHLYDRYSTVSSERISSGLGLSIIKEIGLKNNWKLEYKFEQQFHTFSLSFS